MKVAYIVPGSGGPFYCQNCLRDLALVKALRAEGHDAIAVPMYLPLNSDDQNDVAAPPRIFYGAVKIYLEQMVPALARLPAAVLKLLDSAPILRYAARKAGSTRATGLEDMTISMLRGEEGRQAQELDQLVDWLASEVKPDVVHLSNALLLGLARRVRKQVGCAVVCSLQDEDTWINPMEEGARTRVWSILAERAGEIDALLAVSDYYAGRMADWMNMDRARIRVVPPGIDLTHYAPASTPPPVPTLGYLSRLSESLGLDVLVDAFLILKADPAHATLKLRATGGQTDDDARFVNRITKRLARAGALDAFEIVPSFERETRVAFLQSLTLLSVPIPAGEAFGLFQIEAAACGVPFVQPNVGAFPELASKTGAGVIYDPNEPAVLARELDRLLKDPPRREELSRAGRSNVEASFSVECTTQQTIAVYEAARAAYAES